MAIVVRNGFLTIVELLSVCDVLENNVPRIVLSIAASLRQSSFSGIGELAGVERRRRKEFCKLIAFVILASNV